MKNLEKKFPKNSVSSNQLSLAKPVFVPGYHGVTPSRAIEIKGAEDIISNISISCQLTIRNKVTFSRHQLCILTAVALKKISLLGIGLSDWYILEYLYSSLLGNKLEPIERNDSTERELSLICKIILSLGPFLPLEGTVSIPEDILTVISYSKWIPSDRTFASWVQNYDLKKYLEIRIVSLDALLERSKTTLRYSSYCKGYGESNHMGRRKKTRISFELDGEEETERIISLSDISQLLNLNQLELRYRNLKK
jgi:hypothetical protein